MMLHTNAPPRLTRRRSWDGTSSRAGSMLSAPAWEKPPSKNSSQGRSTWNPPDRKSTRLNSSHVAISYAVFCLKKKKKKKKENNQQQKNTIQTNLSKYLVVQTY